MPDSLLRPPLEGDLEMIYANYDIGEKRSSFTVRLSEMNSIAFSPDDSLLASISNRFVYLWKVKDGSFYKTIGKHPRVVLNIAFSPDGEFIAVGELTDIYLWRVTDGSLVWKNSGGGRPMFSPDGNVLVYPHFLRVADGSLITSIVEHQSVYSVSFSPDGTQLASGSSDGTISIWQTANNSLYKSIELMVKFISSESRIAP
jgi:WD40 repeat protein